MNEFPIRAARISSSILAIVFLTALPCSSFAQNQVPDQGRSNPAAWRPSFSPTVGAAPEIRPGVTKVTRTFEKLPNAAGQVWREYDITPYTAELPNIDRPEQAVIDWIVKETGTRLWFSEPMGVLSADRKRVIVYHTPEIQRVVKSILDRFNRTRAQAQVFEINGWCRKKTLPSCRVSLPVEPILNVIRAVESLLLMGRRLCWKNHRLFRSRKPCSGLRTRFQTTSRKRKRSTKAIAWRSAALRHWTIVRLRRSSTVTLIRLKS